MESLKKWNEELNEKYPMKNPYFHPNPVIRFVERGKVKEIIENIDSGKNVLDAGCEEGYILKKIAEKSPIVLGLDIAENSLNKAKRKNIRNANLILGDIQFFPFKEHYFDIVVCSEVLEHLPFPEQAINELARVTKVGGKIIFSIPNEMRILAVKKILLKFKLDFLLGSLHNQIAPGHLHVFDTSKLIKMLPEDNLKILKIKKIPHVFGFRIIVVVEKIK